MKKRSETFLGSFYIVLSAIFYASYGVWSKLMGGVFGEFNQAWIRAGLALLLILPFGVLTKSFTKIKKPDWKWFIVIALAGGLNQAPYYYGFQHLYVGTATLLFYLMLVVGIFLFGKYFFDEKITKVKSFSLLLATIGLGIIYKFVLTPEQILPAISVMVAGLMGAAGVVFTKKLSSGYSETQIMTSYFVAMLPTNLLLGTIFHETAPVFALNTPWLALFGYLAAHLLSNYAVIAGFKYLEPAVAGLLGLVEVIFAAIFGVILFGEVITTNLLIGSVFILVAAALPDAARLMAKKR